MKIFDVVVIGCGGVGSSALYNLSRRGLDVAGIDRFSPPHNMGSTHGHTRAIRKAYFEHPDYVPLLERCYDLWRELELEAQINLLTLSGILEIGPANGILIDGVKESADLHNLEVDFLTGADVMKRFPGVVVPEGYKAAFESEGGYLFVEQCVESYLSLARSQGASLFTNTTLLGWKQIGDSIRLETTRGVIECGGLVVAGGPWSSSILGSISELQLSLYRKHMYWYANTDQRYLASSGLPVFAFELTSSASTRIYYGFPQLNQQGVKIAEHTRGVLIDQPESTDGDTDPFVGETEEFLANFLPGVSSDLVSAQSCIYSMSHDENFYVDIHPEYDNVVYAAGLSGHGFKFAPVLGEILTDLVTGTTPAQNIDFLRTSSARRTG